MPMNIVTKFDDSRNIFFISDTHFGHANICRGTSAWEDLSGTRDFDDLDSMNNKLVENINSVVAKDDILIHLGDFSFGGIDNIAKFRNLIVCDTIHLILGNHDKHIEENKNNTRSFFSSINETMLLEYKRNSIKFNFFVSHLPLASWPNMGWGVMHLHGHTHLPNHLRLAEGKAMDVGVDGNNLEPIHIETVIELLRNKPIANLTLKEDHHI